jgi:TonB-linked SusC/RagA family outer membrane protein
VYLLQSGASPTSLLRQQPLTVQGIVSDKNEPLVGVSIFQVGSTNGTSSDIDGKFKIDVPVGAKLKISYIGYVTQEILISSSNELNIVMVMDENSFEELVVIGYGSVRKSDLTGSVASIKAEDFINTAVSSIDQGIQGKAAGVVVSMSSGQPGAPSSVRIRGTTSIYGTNEPLYVIDGVFIVPETNVGAVTGPSLNPLASINPADVESVEILKDASATAIYGTRGANGVILITTKRGKKGAPVITFNYTKSIQQLRKKIPMLNAAQLAILGNEAADNEDADRRNIYASPTNLGEGTDWQDEIFRTAPMDNFQVSVRGGSENSTFAISANYFKQEGIIENSDFEKGNLRINLDQKLSSKISIGTSLNINSSALHGVVTDAESAIPSSVTSWALAYNPGLAPYDSLENNTSQPAVGDPVADINKTKQLSTSTRLLGNFFLTYDIIKDLQFKSSISTDAVFLTEKSFIPNDIKRGQASNGQAAIANQKGLNWTWENTLSYAKTFGIHNLNAVVGYSMQAYENEYVFTATSDFDDNRLGYDAIQAGKDNLLSINRVSGWQLQSFLGRVNYTLMDKYLFTASARIDGSSKFGTGNRYGLFPSFAVAWRMKEESFLKSVDMVSDLKVRVGYGVVGNEGIPPYSSMGLLETTEAYFGENESDIAKGSGPDTRQNDLLKWETTSQFDIGLDIGILNDRITLVTDVYYKKTTDVLLNAPVPYTSGYAEAFLNVGSIDNKGIEFAINTVNTTQAIKWNTSLNLAFNRNMVLDISRDEIPSDPMLGIQNWTSIKTGTSMGTLYGYKTDGIIQLGDDLVRGSSFCELCTYLWGPEIC